MSSTQKVVIVFAGPNGSGKSTLTDMERKRDRIGFAFPGLYINPDEILLNLMAVNTGISEEEGKKRAFRRARNLRQKYREQGLSFAFESVFSHPSNLRDLDLLRDAGYQVELNWVTTGNSEINVGRVCSRRDAGGHFIEPDKVRARYDRGMKFLPRAVETATSAVVYDNSRGKAEGLVPSFYKFSYGCFTDEQIPDYLNQLLVIPLTEREAERKQVQTEFGASLIQLPDEELGVYDGPLLHLGKHYAIQQYASEGLVRHDLCVLPRNIDRSVLSVGTRTHLDYSDWYTYHAM